MTATWEGGVNSSSERVEVNLRDWGKNDRMVIGEFTDVNNVSQSFSWTIPAPYFDNNRFGYGSDYRIYIRLIDNLGGLGVEEREDVSDSSFSILASCSSSSTLIP